MTTIAALVLGAFYAVGAVGHLIPTIRGFVMATTPWVLAASGIAVIIHSLAIGAQHRPAEPTRTDAARTLVWFAATYLATFVLEAVGVATGAVFGRYVYGEVLGPKLLGVPVVIGFNWALVVLGAAELSRNVLRGPVSQAAATGVIAVLFDLALEPVAVRLGYWTWLDRGAVFVGGPGVNVPLRNFVAWFIVAFAAGLMYNLTISRAQLALPSVYLGIQFLFFVVLGVGIAGGVLT